MQNEENGQQRQRTFQFDHIFDEDSSQEDIYNQSNVDKYLDKLIEGYHSTIFAYG